MRFDDFEKHMRTFEESIDQFIPQDKYIVVRIDGRSFTKLTKETMKFEAPFDVRFKDMMLEVCKRLFDCGFNVRYIYTQSDEISLLLDYNTDEFGRKVRKYNSTFAGEASAAFSLCLGRIATFDSRIIPLPSADEVIDYFMWRQGDSMRNSLDAYCYWTLRKEGLKDTDAGNTIKGQTMEDKLQLLKDRDIDYYSVPAWQRKGIGIYKEEYEKQGFNPVTGKAETAIRNRLRFNVDLPEGEEYRKMIGKFVI